MFTIVTTDPVLLSEAVDEKLQRIGKTIQGEFPNDLSKVFVESVLTKIVSELTKVAKKRRSGEKKEGIDRHFLKSIIAFTISDSF